MVHYNNQILASLSKPQLARVAPHLKPVRFPLGKPLNDPVDTYAYFLEQGIASVVVHQTNGATVEVGVVGCDGIVGLPILFGTARAPVNITIQIAGEGFRLPASSLVAEFERSPEFRRRLLHYVHAYFVQISQTAACNRLHSIEERLARWLLSCRDRMSIDQLALTHEFMADMLGSPRTTVTLAAGSLEKAGLIKRSRGAVTILDRNALEAAACECYRVVHDEYARFGFFRL